MSKDIIDPNVTSPEAVKNCNLRNMGGFGSALADTIAMLSHIMVVNKKEEPIAVEPEMLEDPVKKIEGEVEDRYENIIDAEFVDE